MKRRIIWSLISIVTFGIGAAAVFLWFDCCKSHSTPPEEISRATQQMPVTITHEDNKSSRSSIPQTLEAVLPSQYQGCLNGMRGGRLKITSDRIIDRGSNEAARYKLRDPKNEPGKVKYILESEGDFPKSFLAHFIVLYPDEWGTIGIETFDTYDDIFNEKLVGMGLFEKVPCSKK